VRYETRIFMASRLSGALVFVLVLAGSGFAVREYRRGGQLAEVPTASARQGDFLVLVRCRGELVADRSEQLTAPLDVPDLQIVWMAPAGGPVKKGQTVVKFDPSKSEQDLKEKEAALAQAQATLDQAEAQAKIVVEQDKLDLANAKYQVEKARLEASKQAIVSAMQGQQSAIDLGLAEEKLKVQEAAIDVHNKSNEAKSASLVRLRDAAKAWVDLTKRRLGLMELTSPLDGIINYLPNYSQGWLNAQPYKVGDHAVAGGALAEIPDLNTIEMEAKVDEVDRGRIAVDDTVLVHVDAFPEKTMNAKLGSIAPLTERSFNEWPPTSSFRAFARIDHPDSRLRPGMNAGADIVQTKLPGAISIPAKALFARDGKPAVYVKRGDRYALEAVRVIARNPDDVAVEGIAAGALVALAEPPTETRDGQ
jgi:multidrug efflux pump subunit AcrA (membrane-fusion protein)